MRSLLAALVIAAFLSATGCAVGITTFKTNPSNLELKKSLKEVKFSYQTENTVLRLALERVLIESYNVQDIQPLQKATGYETKDRVVITGTVVPEPTSKWQDLWAAVGLLSFAVIPSIYDANHDIVLKAIRKNMIISEKRYRVVERSYNWLPLALASPDHMFFLIDGGEIGQQAKKITVYNQIVSDFLSEVGRSLERQPS